MKTEAPATHRWEASSETEAPATHRGEGSSKTEAPTTHRWEGSFEALRPRLLWVPFGGSLEGQAASEIAISLILSHEMEVRLRFHEGIRMNRTKSAPEAPRRRPKSEKSTHRQEGSSKTEGQRSPTDPPIPSLLAQSRSPPPLNPPPLGLTPQNGRSPGGAFRHHQILQSSNVPMAIVQ